MEQAIEKKRLKIGYKLSICGAQIIGDRVAQSPLSIKDNSTMLSITTNGCLPARWDTKLGYQKKKLIIRTLPTIFDDGGLVPALDIVVCRKMPILYSESLPNGTIVTRTAKEEEEVRRMAHGYGHYGGLHRQSSCISIPNFRTDQRTSNTPHLDRTLSEPRSFEDRRVSGYFKIRICDSNSLSNRHWATLLLSNANELNHLDIVEGNRYKIFFVMPYQPKNKKYLGLDLKTTRMTRWEPVPNINITNTYIPRFLTECKDIRHQDTISDFDLVILILQIGTATLEHLNGRKLWHQTLLVTDESEGICQIDLKLPFNPIPDIKGQVIGLVNVRYETYDSKFDITCLKATDETEVLSKASSAAEYMQKGLSKLRNWVQSNPDRIHTITERIQNLIQ
ncbi:uncharacterized protein BX663DRAFT_442662 [Cokeromyces recurvatus]|uniref:uncharacterized protein n=1 Tax=Cokeromyces recurvatus TaxID=90255 RepID=UPI00221EE430|nr:uncharacterized protein BX663DRAFT_442662 [Cokeromyces recurvatus]KAI7898668.1 hypothetical protein BX663DRAFT_442662 [Cokeromyces recurvatus]